MRLGRFGAPGRRRRGFTALVLAILMGVPTTLAILHQGFPVTDPDLRSRDVWVTNGDGLLAGRLNRQIAELDAAVATASRDVDVLQHGDDVFLHDRTLGTVERVDPSFTTLTQRIEVPPGSIVAHGGGVLAILSPEGELWTTSAAGELAFDAASAEPRFTLGTGARVAVSGAGTVFASSRTESAIVRIPPDGGEPVTVEVPDLGAHQLAAVGERAVILDEERDLVLVDGREIELPEPGLRLQQSGADHDRVYVAAASALIAVPLGGGAVEVIGAGRATDDAPARAADGVAAPVWLDGCAHAAWAGSATYLVDCDDVAPRSADVPRSAAGSRLEFRVNREVIALNDLVTGNSWLVDSDLRLVDDWEAVTPPEDSDDVDGAERSARQSFEDTLAERTDVNRPPVARDDDHGVRPGRTTVLEVIENDTDPDGDVLTVSGTSEVPASRGRLEVIDGGRALQFTPAEGATGTTSFRYTVEDGRNGVSEASVDVRIVPDGENAAPVAPRSGGVGVEQGQRISYNVLADWIDPDGDDLYLVNAESLSSDDVRFGPDGRLTFDHGSGEVGSKEVRYLVSDGDEAAEGVLAVDVRPVGTLDPVGTPDFAEAFTGETVVIRPLDNDLSPSGAPLALLGLTDAPTSVSAVVDTERGTIAFTANEPGDHTFLYDIGAEAAVGVGLVRVRVTDPPADAPPPVAVTDTAYLRQGEPVSVPVLANDVSPSGRVLAVQSVDDAEVADLVAVEVLTNTVVRITASEALDRQLQLRYTISDGTASAGATITVVPVPPLVKHQPPIAVDDAVRVRAGDVVSVPVLDNDEHPDGGTLHLERGLDSGRLGDGLAFVDDDRVRFQAPEEPGSYSVAYTIRDDFEQTARAGVAFTVVAKDAEDNRPPSPAPLVSRTFAGSAVTIDVPLDGLDPDGDSVVLTGTVGAPALGRIVDRTSTSITYEAFAAASGTDAIGYEVRDALGSRATGTIRVGVVPRPDTSPPPKAVDDAIDVLPGRTVSVEVLLNDSDPSGHALRVTRIGDVDPALDAEVRDRRRIVVRTPADEGAFTVRYEISNGHGGADSGFLHLTVDRDAAVAPPTAEDQVIEPDDVVGVDEVTVRPLDDATNPGGLVDDLVVSVEGPNAGRARVEADGRIVVRPAAERYAVAFRLANELDGVDAKAFVIVPPADDGAEADPYLADVGRIVIPMNGRVEWEVGDLVIAPSGRTPRILSATSTNGGASPLVDEDTLRYVPAPDYRGQATVTFEVTDRDGTDSGDEENVFLTVPVLVGDPDFEDVPPTFTPRIESIEAGEPAIGIDLGASVDHPNPAVADRVAFSNLSGASSDIAAAIDGASLSVSAPLGVLPGTATRLSFDVTFGEFTVPGHVDVKVVSSTRAKPQANDDGPVEMTRSDAAAIDVLSNDVNPFPDTPLQVVAAALDQADVGSSASVGFTSTGITVRTGAAFTGTLSVIYRIRDATGDPARETQGRATVIVRDAPDQPDPPTIVGEQDGAVTVRWAAPASNNAPITGYRLSWGDGSAEYPPDAAGMAHTVTGLANGTAYRFSVIAVNAIGPSAPSASSAPAVPYGLPGAPSGATLTASATGDAALSLRWGAPGDDGGRAVTRYEWTFEGTPGGAGSTSSTTATTTGTNGTGSRYFVAACNAAGCGPRAMSNTATPTMPWTPANPATVITNACPEPDSTYNNPPTNADTGCTMNPAGAIPAGTLIDAVCRSQRNGADWFYMMQESGVYNGWFIRASDTDRAGRSVADC
ncbi:Ig-like domain-containing protein [Agromyces bauzanensis]